MYKATKKEAHNVELGSSPFHLNQENIELVIVDGIFVTSKSEKTKIPLHYNYLDII
jgi:hypothetical protein